MKRIYVFAALLLAGLQTFAQPGIRREAADVASLEYFYLVKNATYNQAIPTPYDVLGYFTGERFVDWGDALRYATALDKASDRVSFKTFGKTYEGRPFMQVYITSPANQTRLETIRQEHLKLTDSKQSASLDLARMPIVINLMGSVHGNEASGINALIPVMYYYAACEDATVKELLDNAVLVFTPGQNPDGLSRFATNINAYSSYNASIISSSTKEHSLPWPSARSNHYWMDTNRDWLTAQMFEGQNFVKMYEYWMPNVVLDLHEQGSGRSGEYYFSPGDANRTHYCIPQKNQDITETISHYTQHVIDSVGITYFTKKGYDDFFIGKGACYGDVQGSVCILHEQSGTYGHMRDFKERGVRTFAETVRNQSIATMAVINGSYDNRDEIKEYLREFYKNAAKDAASDANKGYTFSARGNRGIAYHFIENLLLHEIDVYPVAGETDKWYVPFEQKHYKKLKTIFDDITEYNTKTFYDISCWGPAYGYNLQKELVAIAPAVGEKITDHPFPQGEVIGGRSTIGYAFNLAEYYTPAMMENLQNKGVVLKVAAEGFAYKYKAGKIDKQFPKGTIVVPVEGQTLSADELYTVIAEQAAKCAVDLESLKADRKKGFDISGITLQDVRNPKTLIATDMGDASRIGEDWYLLDYRYNMKHCMIDFKKLNDKSFQLSMYDALILCGPVPQQSTYPIAYANITKWVNDGGTLILQEGAYTAANIAGANIEKIEGDGVKGVILNAEVKEADSPLLWGYDQVQIPVMMHKAGTFTLPENAETVLAWAENPYVEGYITKKDLEITAGTPVVATIKCGKGAIVFIGQDLNFRSYWYGTSHILTNAIFFGDKL